MARSEHLPIYKGAYDLCLYLEQVVRGFSRDHRYGIGKDMREAARRVLRLVVRANAQGDKRRALLALREELEELKVLVRLGHDVKAFASFNSFEHATSRVVEIAKQNEGWLRSQGGGHGRNRRGDAGRLAPPSAP